MSTLSIPLDTKELCVELKRVQPSITPYLRFVHQTKGSALFYPYAIDATKVTYVLDASVLVEGAQYKIELVGEDDSIIASVFAVITRRLFIKIDGGIRLWTL